MSNCGSISYSESPAQDAGFQADTVVPGFAARFDVEDLVELAGQCAHLVIAGAENRRSAYTFLDRALRDLS